MTALRRTVAVALLVIIAGAAVGLGVERWLHEALNRPYGIAGGEPAVLVVEPGTPARTVAARLVELGVLESTRPFLLWLWWTGRDNALQAGEYLFAEPLTPIGVGEKLLRGRVRLYRVTIVEGATRWQVAAAIAEAGFGTLEEALAATTDVGLIADLDPVADTLEGYLYPDTYLAPRGSGADDLVAAMVQGFRDVWTTDRAAAAEELEMSVRDVVTLASLIEAEAAVAHERTLISAVFHNRLRRGMLLQCDPTVLYAMWLEGRTERNIRRSDLRMESPYNTYVVPGLPAGPIGNPRAASLDAALAPADVEHLYFVARNDGSHVFSNTLREHNRMVDRYQR